MLQVMYDWGKMKLRQCFCGRKGQGITEYAVILGIVVLIGIAMMDANGLESKIKGLYNDVGTALTNLGNKIKTTS